MDLKPEEQKEITARLKSAMKGRPLYFGLMAVSGRKGKFRVSKKKSDTKSDLMKSKFNPYEKSEDNDLKGTACSGVCQGKDGTLTLTVKGKAPAAATAFLEFLVMQRLKLKSVKAIVIAESEEVPDISVEEILKERIKSLQMKVHLLTGSKDPFFTLLEQAATLLSGNGDLDQAEDCLDKAEALLSEEPTGDEVEVEIKETGSKGDVNLNALANRLQSLARLIESLPTESRPAAKKLHEVSQEHLKAGTGEKAVPERLAQAKEVADELAEMIDGAFQDFFLNWLKSLKEHESKLKEHESEKAAAVHRLIAAAKDKIRTRDWEAATNLSREAESALRALSGENKVPEGVAQGGQKREEQRGGGEWNFDAATLTNRWQLVLGLVDKGIIDLASKLKVEDDKECELIIEQGLAEMRKRIEQFSQANDLRKALVKLELASSKDRGTQKSEVLKMIQAWTDKLLNDSILSKAFTLSEENPFAVKVQIRRPLELALKDLRTNVEKLTV